MKEHGNSSIVTFTDERSIVRWFDNNLEYINSNYTEKELTDNMIFKKK